ncbi:hypothetical protein V6N13_054425 [Hibiscus sabdariffa]|uniref:Uncharacterized protein n=1 Tax=Hibiscus sabdariffa TaxID=183260 RepID=A0ABR2DXU9_9ROSI
MLYRNDGFRLQMRLHIWSLGDLTVKYIGGRRFFIDVNDEELLCLLEKQQWSLLKEALPEFQLTTKQGRIKSFRKMVGCCQRTLAQGNGLSESLAHQSEFLVNCIVEERVNFCLNVSGSKGWDLSWSRVKILGV